MPTTLDLSTLDPATLPASAELDALVAEWRGWKRGSNWYGTNVADGWIKGPRTMVFDWSPSTNPAHAGEARREAEYWEIERTPWVKSWGVYCRVYVDESWFTGSCGPEEVNGDKGRAEALATCRAIAAAMKARKL